MGSGSGGELKTLSSRPCSPLHSADRDRPSATSIKPTTAFRAAIGTTLLAYIMLVTSELLVVARAACGLCLKEPAWMSGMIVSALALIFNQSPEGRTLIARVCSGRQTDRVKWSCSVHVVA